MAGEQLKCSKKKRKPSRARLSKSKPITTNYVCVLGISNTESNASRVISKRRIKRSNKLIKKPPPESH